MNYELPPPPPEKPEGSSPPPRPPRPPVQSEPRARAPRPERRGPERSVPLGGPSSDAVERWTWIAAIATLAGALLPAVMPWGNETIWIWEQIGEVLDREYGSGAAMVVYLLSPLALGGVVMWAHRSLGDPVRLWALVGIPALYVVWAGVGAGVGAGWFAWSDPANLVIGMGQMVYLFFGPTPVLMAVSVALALPIRAGARAGGLRFAVGLCGVGLLLVLLTPAYDDKPLAFALFTADLWDAEWVHGIAILATLALAGFSVAMLGRSANAEGLAVWIVRAGWVVALGLPVLTVVHAVGNDLDLIPAVVNAAKWASLMFGPLVLFGAGICRFVDAIGAGPGAPISTGEIFD